MSTIDPTEIEILEAFEKGQFKSVATKSGLEQFKVQSSTTGTVISELKAGVVKSFDSAQELPSDLSADD